MVQRFGTEGAEQFHDLRFSEKEVEDGEIKSRYKSSSIFDMQFITSSISTTLVLLLLGLVVFFVLTAHNLSVYVRENISFSILISDDMKEADILKLQKKSESRTFRETIRIYL